MCVYICIYTHTLNKVLPNCLTLVCVRRGLRPVCGRGDQQLGGPARAPGPEELSQWPPLDGGLEPPAGLPVVPQLPELVQGAAAESR